MGRPRKSTDPLPPWAQRIKTLRDAKHLSQAALGEMIGVKQQAVGEWERGANYPRATTLTLLAVALGVSPSEIAPHQRAVEEDQTPFMSQHEVDQTFARLLMAFNRRADEMITPPLPDVNKIALFRHFWRAAGGSEDQAPELDRAHQLMDGAIDALALADKSITDRRTAKRDTRKSD